jgi:hypothetical protein
MDLCNVVEIDRDAKVERALASEDRTDRIALVPLAMFLRSVTNSFFPMMKVGMIFITSKDGLLAGMNASVAWRANTFEAEYPSK